MKKAFNFHTHNGNFLDFAYPNIITFPSTYKTKNITQQQLNINKDYIFYVKKNEILQLKIVTGLVTAEDQTIKKIVKNDDKTAKDKE